MTGSDDTKMTEPAGTEGTDRITIRQVHARAYRIPTDWPEADGTLEWNDTTLILAEVHAGDITGIGYTYGNAAIATVITGALAEAINGRNILDIPSVHTAMKRHIRNEGHAGLAMMALSAVDCALWDAKAKLLAVPLYKLLGRVRKELRIYGSGGFTGYTDKQLEWQLSGWKEAGIKDMKIKVGRDPARDIERVRQARQIIGDGSGLFVDANGAYTCQQALQQAVAFNQAGVSWLEEPVSSDDLTGLNFIRQRTPAGMRVAAGEYGYDLVYFRRMLAAGAVDVLQADATRCGGITGFINAGRLCEAYGVPFSSHCAPTLHMQAALSLPSFFIAEYFHDHVRIESMLFEGCPGPRGGVLVPDPDLPGLGIVFRYADAKKYMI